MAYQQANDTVFNGTLPTHDELNQTLTRAAEIVQSPQMAAKLAAAENQLQLQINETQEHLAEVKYNVSHKVVDVLDAANQTVTYKIQKLNDNFEDLNSRYLDKRAKIESRIDEQAEKLTSRVDAVN